MKYVKSAAFLAGSMVALGAAAPAVAADVPESAQQYNLEEGTAYGIDRSLNNEVTKEQLDETGLRPLAETVVGTAKVLKGGTEKADDGVQGLTGNAGQLLGGLPLG